MTSQHPEGDRANGSQADASEDDLAATLAKIAEETGGTFRAYPGPGRAVRRVVLRDLRDDRGSQYEVAQVEDDGTLRVTGHDRGQAVSDFFGDDITSYEWVYVVRPDRVGALLTLLKAQDGDDLLTALAAYYERAGGRIRALLKHPDVAAEFDTWHS